MSTRSWIGIENKDGTVNASYCHFDGYPSNNGKILLESYTKYNKIRSIASKRCFRSLKDDPKTVEVYPDSGEWNCKFLDRDDFLSNCCEDYTYLYTGKKWIYRAWRDELQPLTESDCK